MKNAIEKILNKKDYDAYELINSLSKLYSQRGEDNSQSFIIKMHNFLIWSPKFKGFSLNR